MGADGGQMHPAETHRADVEIDALFWRSAFDENGDLRAGEWDGAFTATADWQRGDFTTICFHRMPVPGWDGDQGDVTEIKLINVRFPANRLRAHTPNCSAGQSLAMTRDEQESWITNECKSTGRNDAWQELSAAVGDDRRGAWKTFSETWRAIHPGRGRGRPPLTKRRNGGK